MTDPEATAAVRAAMPLCATLGVTAEAYGPERVSLRLDWDPSLCTAGGVLHGGTLMALADSAAGACALLNLPAAAAGTATIESKTNFLAAVRNGSVTATAAPLHLGARTIVVETSVHDDRGRLVAKTTQTQIVITRRALTG